MAHVELVCDICRVSRMVDERQVDGLIAAVHRGEQISCGDCGASLNGPFQRTLGLALPEGPPRQYKARRRYVRGGAWSRFSV